MPRSIILTSAVLHRAERFNVDRLVVLRESDRIRADAHGRPLRHTLEIDAAGRQPEPLRQFVDTGDLDVASDGPRLRAATEHEVGIVQIGGVLSVFGVDVALARREAHGRHHHPVVAHALLQRSNRRRGSCRPAPGGCRSTRRTGRSTREPGCTPSPVGRWSLR